MLKKISIITVCFNSVKTLAKTLASVKMQTWYCVEHIVIDGASTDGTVELIKQHEDQISHWLSEPDRGIYDAMNKGLALATGDVVCFLNADDHYAYPQVLEEAMDAIESQNLDAFFGDVAFFRPHHPAKIIRRFRSSMFKPSRLQFGWMSAHPALFVRRDVFLRVGDFKIDYKISGDFEWIARAFKTDQLVYQYLPKIMVHMQAGGISTGGLRSKLLLNREVLRACRENHIRSNWLKLLAKYPFKLLDYWFI